MNMNFIGKLPIPQEIKQQYPLTDDLVAVKAERDIEIKKVFTGESDKFILVIGPCSADREDSVLDYISRLREVQEKVKDKLVIIPRIYTGKPRTTGDGYKGMLHQPNPDEKPDMYKGIVAIRELHMSALKDYGFTCADEMLYPENHRYLSDLLAYVRFYPAVSQIRLTDYKVRVLDGKSATASRVRVLIESTDGTNSWTTVGVSSDVMEASWLALCDSFEYKLIKDIEKHLRSVK